MKRRRPGGTESFQVVAAHAAAHRDGHGHSLLHDSDVGQPGLTQTKRCLTQASGRSESIPSQVFVPDSRRAGAAAAGRPREGTGGTGTDPLLSRAPSTGAARAAPVKIRVRDIRRDSEPAASEPESRLGHGRHRLRGSGSRPSESESSS